MTAVHYPLQNEVLFRFEDGAVDQKSWYREKFIQLFLDSKVMKISSSRLFLSYLEIYDVFLLSSGNKIYVLSLEEEGGAGEGDGEQNRAIVKSKCNIECQTSTSNAINQIKVVGDMVFVVDSKFSVYILRLDLNE